MTLRGSRRGAHRILTDAHPTPEPLQQAAELLRQGEFEAASKQLASFLQEHPGSADAWVLFSYALEDPVREVEAQPEPELPAEQPEVVAPFQPEARAELDAAQAPQVPPFSVPIPAPAEAQAAADTPPEFLADLEAAASP